MTSDHSTPTPLDKTHNPLRNEQGFVLVIVLFIFAICGAWCMSQSYNQGNLQRDMGSIADDLVDNFKKVLKH